jgi:hypothetical protein
MQLFPAVMWLAILKRIYMDLLILIMQLSTLYTLHLSIGQVKSKKRWSNVRKFKMMIYGTKNSAQSLYFCPEHAVNKQGEISVN